MYPPAKTVVHTKNGKPAIEYRTPPIMSWPNPTTDDLLSAIDKVEVATAYECEIDQTLMVDYIHLNRLSTISRLENVTRNKIQNDDENNDQCKQNEKISNLTGQNSKQIEQISILEEQNSKQENLISNIDEQNSKQEKQLNNLEEKNSKQISYFEEQNGRKEKKISILEEQNSRQDKKISNLEEQNSKQAEQFSNLEEQKSKLENEISNLEEQNSRQEVQISNMEEQISNLKKDHEHKLSDTNAKATHIEKLLHDLISRGKDQKELNLTFYNILLNQTSNETDIWIFYMNIYFSGKSLHYWPVWTKLRM